MVAPILSSQEVDDFIILRAVALTNRVQRTLMRDVLKTHDLPLLEWRILFSIARFGDCHLGYICKMTSLDPAHGSRAVGHLEARGLIERYIDPKDNRRRLMRFTPKGRSIFDQAWPEAQTLIKQITDGFDEQELSILKKLLDRANGIANTLLEESLQSKAARDAA
ncbi:MAG: MarR family winged helix-turn-helix transcriptional regulator [Pseudomonadota bacterium]